MSVHRPGPPPGSSGAKLTGTREGDLDHMLPGLARRRGLACQNFEVKGQLTEFHQRTDVNEPWRRGFEVSLVARAGYLVGRVLG